MDIILIAALTKNRVIGKAGAMPWHLSVDLKRFKKQTLNNPIIMGRKTFESIGSKPLPNRRNIVITRQSLANMNSCEVVESPAAAVELLAGSERVFIIGGGKIYQQFLPQATHLYLTEIDAEIEGDTYFPQFDKSEWEITNRESHAGKPPFAFVNYQRV